MIYIAHRGLFDGYNEEMENHPDQIRAALDAGFDAEIDVRLIDGKWFLGHDAPVHEVEQSFLSQAGLWLHCKNEGALIELTRCREGFNFFWHQSDDFTLTSGGFIWTYPGKTVDPEFGVRVQPEWNKYWREDVHNIVGYGVCSKFVSYIKEHV
jgi:hypothetical protein